MDNSQNNNFEGDPVVTAGSWKDFSSADKIISVILRLALDGRASDIHLEPGLPEARVRFRVDGSLHTSLVLPAASLAPVICCLKKLSGLPAEHDLNPQAANFKIDYQGDAHNILAYFLPTADGEKVVLHIIPRYNQPLSLAELGFLDYHLLIINHALERNGLFLVTGPVDSGKTATLYSLLNILNGEEVNACTLEEPIERYLPGVNQLTWNPLQSLALSNMLEFVLRQNPDVLMIDDLTDSKAAVISIESASDRKILTALPTKSVKQTVEYLRSLEASPFLLADNLKLIINQRLVKRVCEHCRQKVTLTPELADKIKKIIIDLPEDVLETEDLEFYEGSGCENCGGQGYQGRIAIAEILETNSVFFDPATGQKRFVSMLADGIIKASKGLTTLKEVFKVIN